MTQSQDSEVMFFLGAGASVKAGVPDTYQLVDGFRKDNESDTQLSAIIDRILDTLKKWKRERDTGDNRVDVELLLEALDKMKLESRERDLLLRFYKEPEYLLPGYPEKGEIIKKLRSYIKRRAVVDRDAISYLDPLLAVLNAYAPLDIFSVNYDILIEQFSTLHQKQLSDGFDTEWNRDSFRRSRDIRLYKLHGSVTWYKTKHADYVKVPVLARQDEIELITGEKATSLILYPMHKWDYDEPLLDLLMMLKNRLQTARYCIVVGYSFRDEHITRVFWDAARNNRDLQLIMISPHSPRTYLSKLKFYEQPADPKVSSSLSGRVVSLPYKFEDIFFELTNTILGYLINALRWERDTRTQEIAQGKADWGQTIKSFIDAEHYEKVTDLLGRTPWDEALKNWQDRIQYTFRLWLLATTREDSESSAQWAAAFQLATLDFDTNKLNPYVVNQLVALNFTISPNSTINPNALYDVILPISQLTRRRAAMFPKPLATRLSETAKALADIESYLSLWKTGAILIPEYVELRTPKQEDREVLLAIYNINTSSPGLLPNMGQAKTIVTAIEQKIWTDLMTKLHSAVTEYSVV